MCGGSTASGEGERQFMNRIFIDMDGVIVDFDSFKTKCNTSGDEVKKMPGAYLAMEPMPDAIDAVKSLIGMGFEVWVATKPPTGISFAYGDKAEWIIRHLPELKRRIIITHDKGLLGDHGDYLIDDRPSRANCSQFTGTLIHFQAGYEWPAILNYLRTVKGMDNGSEVPWACRFHPTDWFHEVGCSHCEWSKEDLLQALITKKKFELENANTLANAPKLTAAEKANRYALATLRALDQYVYGDSDHGLLIREAVRKLEALTEAA